MHRLVDLLFTTLLVARGGMLRRRARLDACHDARLHVCDSIRRVERLAARRSASNVRRACVGRGTAYPHDDLAALLARRHAASITRIGSLL